VTVSNVVIGYQNLLPSATVTSSGAASGFPVTNVQLGDPFLQWRSTTLTPHLQADLTPLASTSQIKIVAAIGTNLTDAATQRVRVDSESGFSVPHAHDSGTVNAFDVTHPNPLIYRAPAGRDVIYLPGSNIFTASYHLRMNLSDTTNTEGYLRVGIWWGGPIWTPVKGYELEYPRSPEFVDGRVRRTLELSWNWLTEVEAGELINMLYALAGLGRLYLVARDNAPATWALEAMLCTAEQPSVITVKVGTVVYVRVRVRFVEADW
jgi:hypothetical protein